jgi:DNA-binding PadR family transcriptional regulator
VASTIAQLEGDDLRIVRAVVGALRERDLSGFEIWQWLGPLRGSVVELDESGLYPMLHHLEAQGMLRSSWQEDQWTRRTYRITAAGLREAESHGWGAVASRRGRGFASDAGDPEWVWRVREPAANGAAHTGANGSYLARVEAEEIGAAVAPEFAAVTEYLEDLDGALHLSALHRRDVCHEIGDHLGARITRLCEGGSDPEDAAAEAIEALGPAEELAHGIDKAQLTGERLRTGIAWGSAVGMRTALGTVAIIFCVLYFAAPLVGELVVALGAVLGQHLYVPVIPEWRAQELALAGWVGAFLGARRSMPQLAVASRRLESTVWPVWALLGAVPLTLVVLLVPAQMDLMAVLTLLGIPVAWVLGTRYPEPLHGDAVSLRGVVIATAIVVGVMAFPGARAWAFDPSTPTPAGPSFVAGENPSVTWDSTQESWSGHIRMTLSPTSEYAYPRLELRPAVESGLSMIPDPQVTVPLVVQNGDFVDFRANPAVSDWWVSVTATGPDGLRRTIATDVRVGYRIHPRGNILGWLLGHR